MKKLIFLSLAIICIILIILLTTDTVINWFNDDLSKLFICAIPLTIMIAFIVLDYK